LFEPKLALFMHLLSQGRKAGDRDWRMSCRQFVLSKDVSAENEEGHLKRTLREEFLHLEESKGDRGTD